MIEAIGHYTVCHCFLLILMHNWIVLFTGELVLKLPTIVDEEKAQYFVDEVCGL